MSFASYFLQLATSTPHSISIKDQGATGEPWHNLHPQLSMVFVLRGISNPGAETFQPCLTNLFQHGKVAIMQSQPCKKNMMQPFTRKTVKAILALKYVLIIYICLYKWFLEGKNNFNNILGKHDPSFKHRPAPSRSISPANISSQGTARRSADAPHSGAERRLSTGSSHRAPSGGELHL